MSYNPRRLLGCLVLMLCSRMAQLDPRDPVAVLRTEGIEPHPGPGAAGISTLHSLDDSEEDPWQEDPDEQMQWYLMERSGATDE